MSKTDPNLKAPSTKQVVWKWAIIALSLIFSLRYLYWRAVYTLNYQSGLRLLISALLLAAEIYGFVSVLLFFMQALARHENKSMPIEGELPSVDVFIPIVNEPLDILHHTMLACHALDYPKEKINIFVLDDGPRVEVAEFAKRFNCNYIARPDHRHAKAGNFNYALGYAKSEFLALFDVDQMPVSSFLKETLGFFKDPRLAFVKTPHNFYNPDCYQKNLLLEKDLVHEQDLFFQVIEPGKDSANAVVFAGSSAVFRRAALDDIGGFKVDCAIEDLHTGMELQSRGWHSLYYRRILSAGLSPESFAAYITQRKRWTRGGVQLFFLDNPLVKSGLSITQRLHYFASLFYFFHGWARLIYLFAPLPFLLFGWNVIVTPISTLLWYFVPHYICSHMVFNRIAGGYRSPFWSDVYETACSFELSWTAFATMFVPETLVFNVTPKGLNMRKEEFHWRRVIPHIALMGLIILGMIITTTHFMNAKMTLDSYGLSCLWAIFNFILLASSIEVTREHPRMRSSIRFARHFPVVLHAGDQEWVGMTINMSETGALISLPYQIALLKHAVVRILGDGDTAILKCEVRHCRWLKDNSLISLRFHADTEVQRDQIVRLLFCVPNSWDNINRPNLDSMNAFKRIALSTLRKRPTWLNSGRAELIHSAGRIQIIIEDLHEDHAVGSWVPDGSSLNLVTLRLPHRKLRSGFTLVHAEVVEVVGAAAGRQSFKLNFIMPKKINVEPILKALKSRHGTL